jgi:DNA-directed RNA polymerase II subunit RPB2
LPGAEAVAKRKFAISFGQIYLSKPMMTESDGETTTLFPHEARLRNLTCARRSAAHAALRLTRPPSYSAPLYVDINKTITITDDETGAEEIREENLAKVFIGKVPIMLRSKYCSLHDHSDNELAR